ncbi:unnamed protein product [Lactuca saligna]|uniref:Ubiquitin-like protease family profile domain-containing protein n=1 Tax=Lactuca saligna TaxID=75948 RepID=A0AA36EP51_LACSI|nr:unnamed protein product [Lactuca saligna]
MRKKRTATRLVDHKEPQEVDFNNIGQHVGKKQSKFANECGVITRSVISVEYTSWKKVPIAQKDILWSAIKIKSERSLHYVLGRRSKNELGLNIIPPTIQPIMDELVDVQTQISEGDLELSPGEDLLTKTTIDLMGSQLAKLQAHFDLQQGPRNHAPDDVSLGVQQNNCGSTPTLDALDAIKMPTPCELVLPYGELDQKCAKGLVFPYGNGLIHTLPLRKNHLKVLIDDIDSRYENFPVPVMTKEVANLQWTVGTTRMNKCALLNLYNILGEACHKNPEGVVSYLVDSIRLHHGKLFLIAPYLQNKHWVLLVISLRNRVVYILDSLKDRIQKSADYHYLLKKHVDMAFMRYEKNTSTPFGWIFAECNQQLGGLESGHYVRRWMFDFLMTRQHGFPSKSGSIWDDKSPFEEKMLVATVATWSREFLNNYMNDVVL